MEPTHRSYKPIPPGPTLEKLVARFQLTPVELADERISRLLQHKLNLDVEVAALGKQSAYTAERINRVLRKFSLTAADLAGNPTLVNIVRSIVDANLRIACLRPKATEPKETALCFTTTHPKA